MIRSEGDFIIEGFLECTNDTCLETFAIVEGVPIVVKNFKEWRRAQKSRFFNMTFRSAEMESYFKSLEETDHRNFNEKHRLSTYIEFHYSIPSDAPVFMADQADPRPYWDIVTAAGRPGDGNQYARSLDLGCSVGRYTFALARFSETAIGMDLDFSAVSYAAGLQRNNHGSFERRLHGRCFKTTEVSFEFPQNVFFLVADALDPPFRAGFFDMVAGLNLLDNVRLPLVLLGQMDALLASGGRLIVSAPYEWRTDVCEPEQWLEKEGLDATVMVRRILEGKMLPETGFKYKILQEPPRVPWVLRNHTRYWSVFLVHIITAAKR